MIEILPAIAVRKEAPIPNNDLRIEVGREISLHALNLAETKYDSNIILLLQENPAIEAVTPDDILPVGVLAKITLKVKLPSGNYKVKFRLLQRVEIEDFITETPCFTVKYNPLNTVYGNPDEEVALVKMVIDELMPKAKEYLNNVDDVINQIQSGATTEVVCDRIAFNLRSTDTDKSKYVLEADLNRRLNYILQDLKHEQQIIEIENKINESVKKSIDESQKEYYLREKMKAIQTELGDKAKREEDIEAMRKKIKEAKMPERTEKKVLDELRRYQETPSQMADSQILKNYLDFVIGLPWHKASVDNDDLSVVAEALNKEHYALDKVKERIIEYIAVKIMTKKNPQTILCLVGPPGVGKTSLAMSIAQALGRKFIKQSLGGVKDESEVRGHRRTYIGALPGRILKGMYDAQTVNPVFLLDEIDKMSSDYKGDPTSAMLEVLDPEQNHTFSDNYVEEPYDLSQVLFIATANYLENIPAPLRDRMEIVELSSYTKFEKFQIAKEHLISKQIEVHGITDKQFIIDDEAIYHIIEHFTREAGVRELNRYLGSLIRKAIKEILVTKVECVHITKDNINKYLGRDRFTENSIHDLDTVGVVTGLAYTQFGGDTLDVEATYYRGKGGLVLTGKLGDVMKESAQTALSYVKAHADDFKINPTLFNENDIHIHVPEGAIPKDGPSAGVTMATAIVSALTRRTVKRNLGMTGEITLRGAVLPIGGLREKSIAAHRSGLNTILIPHLNIADIEDIPNEVKSALNIIPVKTIEEVINHALN